MHRSMRHVSSMKRLSSKRCRVGSTSDSAAGLRCWLLPRSGVMISPPLLRLRFHSLIFSLFPQFVFCSYRSVRNRIIFPRHFLQHAIYLHFAGRREGTKRRRRKQKATGCSFLCRRNRCDSLDARKRYSTRTRISAAQSPASAPHVRICAFEPVGRFCTGYGNNN